MSVVLPVKVRRNRHVRRSFHSVVLSLLGGKKRDKGRLIASTESPFTSVLNDGAIYMCERVLLTP